MQVTPMQEAINEVRAEEAAEAANTPTTIGIHLKGNTARLYTYQCNRPVKVGDWVNVKLPSNLIVTNQVREVHDTPQLSDKWETKWAVVVQTKEEYEAAQQEGSDLGKELGL